MKQIFAVIGLVFFLAVKSHAYDDGDFQVWNTDSEELKINAKTKITLEQEFRWGDNANELFYQHYDIGLFYSLNKYVSVGAGYRQVYELKSGKFKPEEEPYMTITFLGDLRGFKLSSRNRMEYRHFSYQTDSWRYRNLFTVLSPWRFTKLEIQPYLSDEIFIGFGDISQFNENRFYSGLGFKLTKNLKGDIYYLLRSTKGTDTWVKSNVLGIKLKLAF